MSDTKIDSRGLSSIEEKVQMIPSEEGPFT